MSQRLRLRAGTSSRYEEKHQYYLKNLVREKIRRRQYYYENLDLQRKKSKEWNVKNQEKIRSRNYIRSDEFRKWKGFAGPCVRCDNSDSRVLEFHHLKPEEKKFCITAKSWYSVSLIELIEELIKCIVLCANCHKIEEFETGVWSRKIEVIK